MPKVDRRTFGARGPRLRRSLIVAVAGFLLACPGSAVRIHATDPKGSDIPAATLRIDGRARGETPFRGNVEYGRHEIELSAPGYDSSTLAVEIRSKRLALRIPLARPPHEEDSTFPAGTRVGSLDPAVIDKTIKTHLDEFKKCFETSYSSVELGLGKIVEHFVIERDGRVDVAYPRSTEFAAADLLVCIDQSFRAMKFDPPEGGGVVTVNYPLLFRSR